MKLKYPILDYVGAPLLGVLFITLFIAESKNKLRRRKVSKKKRLKLNGKVAMVGFFALRVILIPAMTHIADYGNRRNFGILYRKHLNSPVSWIFGILLMDYGSYLWHRINHQIPFLWRFHNVHHIDPDLDVSTATRFHFGEVILSVLGRGLIVLISGVNSKMVIVYEIIFEAATNFHHSNIHLAPEVEHLLSKVFVTPSLHGVHHSIVRKETDSNYSVVFSFWDKLNNSASPFIPNNEIDIGVPSYRDFDEQTFLNLMTMPFKKQRPWKLPNGEVPYRL